MISLCSKPQLSQATGTEGKRYHLEDTVIAQLQLLDSLSGQYFSEALQKLPCRNPRPVLLLLVQEPWGPKLLTAVTGANGGRAGWPGLLKHLLLLLLCYPPARTLAAGGGTLVLPHHPLPLLLKALLKDLPSSSPQKGVGFRLLSPSHFPITCRCLCHVVRA